MPLNFSECEQTQKQFGQLLKDDALVCNEKGCNLTNNSESPFAASDFDLSQECKKLRQHYCEENEIDISENFEEDSVVEKTALKHMPKDSKSSFNNATDNDSYLTVPGTIKRGKKKGESVEVILNMSREELEILEADMTTKKGCPCATTNASGFHVLLWTVLCFPVSIIVSGLYSFCMGTITWYNIFKFFSDNEALAYKVVFPPILVIFYPFLITSVSVGLGLYAGARQLSCCWDSWQKEFTDYEKGFYGWICNSLDIPQCCPYEVVILSAIQKA